MTDDTLFAQDQLVVKRSKLTVGNATVFYPSVSATRVYEGRPKLRMGISAAAFLILFGSMGLFLKNATGPLLSSGMLQLALLPFIAMTAIGFGYRLKCLLITVDGKPVPLLKGQDRDCLERAERAIEQAKAMYDSRSH